jgi:release factor glutamine methyltransferase
VLEPRPESETMIDLLKEIVPAGRSVRIADVGTGSGALGITAKLEVPNSEIDLLEIDQKALQVAKMNVDLFTISVSVIQSDLLASTSVSYDILMCNLPYVPDDFQINPAAMREPKIAIFGGPDGLDLYRKLFDQVTKSADQPLYLLTEAMPPQHEELAGIAALGGYILIRSEDFIQVFRSGDYRA